MNKKIMGYEGTGSLKLYKVNSRLGKKWLIMHGFNITAEMLATGDYYIFPATNSIGDIIHSYFTQQQVRILDTDGDNITEAYGIIDWYIDKSNKIYYLLRHHKLDTNGTLNISYSVMSDNGKKTTLDKW